MKAQALIQTFYGSGSWMLAPFVKIMQSFILMENTSIGVGEICGALFGKYLMLSQFSRLSPEVHAINL